MSIPAISPTPPVRLSGTVPAPVAPVQASAPLGPAVRVDIRGQESRGQDAGADPRAGQGRPADARAAEVATKPRIRIDRETKAVVYQEVDPRSGDIVVQLPDPVVLKARAYAAAAEARAQPADRPLDRTA